MIVVAKLTLGILWLLAFVLTCLILCVTFPIIMLFEKLLSMVDVARFH
jgi:hypothetical protein